MDRIYNMRSMPPDFVPIQPSFRGEEMPPPSPNKRKADLDLLWESEARFSRKKEGRARIPEAAAGAFMERGYAATTLDDIAALLGNTKGQIYHYYRSKLDLYFDVAVGDRKSTRLNSSH